MFALCRYLPAALVVLCGGSIGGCRKPSKSPPQGPQESVSESPSAPKPRFSLNVETKDCRDQDGGVGLNESMVGPCANLRGQNLSGHNLSGVDLSGADLEGANLAGANLAGANLSFAKLTKANLKDANLRAAIFQSCPGIESVNFEGAEFDPETILPGTVAALKSRGLVFRGPAITNRDRLPFGRHGAAVVSTSETSITLKGTTGFKADPLTEDDHVILQHTAMRMADLRMSGHLGPWFAKVFGGETTDDVLRYLAERTSFVFLDSISGNGDAGATTVAINLTKLWFLSRLGAKPVAPVLNVNGKKIQIDSPRVGLIAVSQGFRANAFGSMSRITTLIHEARHSDCPTPPTATAFQEAERISALTAVPSCHNSHATCTSGPFKDLRACDAHPWGAYAIGAVFATRISAGCTNCSEFERQITLADAVDNMSRLQGLDGLFDGKHGDPNMARGP